ncbi:MAG: NAD-dependent epimerase/dehydratase family protein, partial [Pseudomonadota bacterium]
MRILITGVAGVLGPNLATYLRANGMTDIVGIDVSDRPFPGRESILFHACDLTDGDQLQGVLEGVDAVVHCASAAPSFSDNEIFAVNVDGTKTLLEAAAAASVKRFVHISSTAVYGIPDRSPVYETDTLQPYHDAYNRSKVAAEEECVRFREMGLIVPILRPRTFLGPGRQGTFAMLNDWASNGRGFPMLGSGRNRYQFLDVEDLCQVIYLCLERPDAAVNDTFNVGAEVFGTMREDYQAVLDRAGYGKHIVPLPAKPIVVALGLLERLKLSPLYGRLYKKLQ